MRFDRAVASLLSLVASACAASAPPRVVDFAIDGVNLVPMTEARVIPHQSVAIQDSRIVAIVSEDEASRFRARERIDGRNTYLMPGLADMHVHLRMPPRAFFNLQIANGVTTVHNMSDADGGPRMGHPELRDAIERGEMLVPRYLISGPQIHREQAPDVAAARQILLEHERKRFDVLKIHGDLEPAVFGALVDGARARGLRVAGHAQHAQPLAQSLRMNALEHVEELLYVSRDDSFAAAGDPEDYLDAYYRNVERLRTPSYRALVVGDVARSGIYVDPTLSIYQMVGTYLVDQRLETLREDPRIEYLPASTRDRFLDENANEYRAELGPLLSGYLERIGSPQSLAEHLDANAQLLGTLVKELHDAGVPLLLGTDAFGALVPGFAVHQELEALVRAGLSPFEALATGTVNVARYLGEADRSGTVEVDKRADLLLVECNPLREVRCASRLRGVFVRGRWLDAPALTERLEQARPRTGSALGRAAR